LLVHFLVIQDVIEVLDHLLLAAYSINLASRNDVENIIDEVAIRVLVLSQMRLLVICITITDNAISLESGCVGHDDQVVQIHQEAKEVEE